MWRLIKKYLISHKGNDHKPHLLRDGGIAVTFLLVLVLFGVSVSSRYILARTDFTALVLTNVLVDFANEGRSEKNFSHLAVNPVLEKAAQLKANDMAEKGYFAHRSPEGHSPWYWFQQAGYSFAYAGENLAVNFSDSKDVYTAWMNSPGHRDNILNNNFTEIGIATAEGMYQGKRTTFVVQLFGTPKTQTKKTTITATSKTTTTQPKPVTTSAKVLSESVSVETTGGNGTSELFVSAVSDGEEVAPPNVEKTSYSNFFERLMASPKKTLAIIYSILSLVILFSLFSVLFVEIKRDHKKMIFLSLGLIASMFGLIYVFQSVILYPLVIV